MDEVSGRHSSVTQVYTSQDPTSVVGPVVPRVCILGSGRALTGARCGRQTNKGYSTPPGKETPQHSGFRDPGATGALCGRPEVLRIVKRTFRQR